MSGTYLACIDKRTDEVDGDGFEDRGVKVPGPGGASGPVQLKDGCETRCCEGDVESHACPVHVCSVERGMPGENDTCDAQRRRCHDVQPATDWFAIKSRVLGCHDGGGDEEGDPRVIDAGEAFHEGLL